MSKLSDYSKALNMHTLNWQKQNHIRFVLDISYPLNDSEPANEYLGTLEQRWLDEKQLVLSTRRRLKTTGFAGDAFPHAYANLGPDIFAALYGCRLKYSSTTSWALHPYKSVSEIKALPSIYSSAAYGDIMRLTEALVNDSHGDYIVDVTDIHPGLDALAALVGPQQLCFDLLEQPERVKEISFELFDGFKRFYSEQLALTKSKGQKGTSNWMGLYHPDSWYVTSCDFMGMISNDMMREFVLPELKAELEFLPHSIFHLDGVGALKHLDTLLTLKKLDGIQWVYGFGQPTAASWIDILKKIQAAGKLIHVVAVPGDLEVLIKNLRPEGVMLSIAASSREEAEKLIEYAENVSYAYGE